MAKYMPRSRMVAHATSNAGRRARRCGNQHGAGQVPSVHGGRNARAVGADPEEGLLAEGDFACKQQQVRGQRQKRDQADIGEYAD